MSPIKKIPLGCKNPDIKHVMSFRHQAFMIFNSQSDPLNLSAKLSIDGKDYTIFISSDSMRCFVCGDFGHIRQTCPNRDRPAGLPAAPAADAENSEKAAGADVTSAAGVSEPQTGEAFSAWTGFRIQDLPQFSEGEKSMLDKLLTFDELSVAVQEMSSGKAPGLDGLNAEFYRQFWPVIGRDLFSVFMESLKKGLFQ